MPDKDPRTAVRARCDRSEQILKVCCPLPTISTTPSNRCSKKVRHKLINQFGWLSHQGSQPTSCLPLRCQSTSAKAPPIVCNASSSTRSVLPVEIRSVHL